MTNEVLGNSNIAGHIQGVGPFSTTKSQEKGSNILKELTLKATTIFGSDAFKKEPGTMQELTNRVFKLVTLELEGVQPLTDKKVKTVFQLLYGTPLKQACQNRGQNHPVTILSQMHDAFTHYEKAGDKALVPTAGKKGKFLGANSSYFMQGSQGKTLWVFKPLTGEKGYPNQVGSRAGINPGRSAKREHVAYLLNKGGMIPYTAYISLGGEVGSLQRFEGGTHSYLALQTSRKNSLNMSKIPLKPMQGMLIFDIRFGNADRHGGNILCRPSYDKVKALTGYEVFGIDHGLCMSASPEDELEMSYLSLPQLTSSPFDDELKDFILTRMDVERDAKLMKKHELPDAAILWMRNASAFLKFALEQSEISRRAGKSELTASDLGVLASVRRDLIWAFQKTREDVQTHLEDILFCKEHLNDLKKQGKLSQGKVKILRLRGFAKSKRGGREKSWLDALFDNIVMNHFTLIEQK